ncbi:hypothetical protein ACFFJX_28040 [Pseudarcicella hirudinis]
MNARIKHIVTVIGLMSFWILSSSYSQAQTITRLKGKVLDSKTGDVIPFANVSI